MTVKRIKREDVVLVVVDFQEKLLPAVRKREELEETMVRLIQGCRVLGTDIIVTEQYPKGLGRTVPAIDAALTEPLFEGEVPAAQYTPIEKTAFSAMRDAAFVEKLQAIGKKTVLLCGIEAHICTQQLCMDLLEEGYNVFVIEDGISSRSKHNKKVACTRMTAAGAVLTTYEAALYEMLERKDSPAFKMISKIVK